MHRKWRRLALCGAGTLMSSPAVAMADADTPSIHGNAWVAVMIILGVIAIIYIMIIGAMQLETRDTRHGRRRDDGWFGIFPHRGKDDDDTPDFHHHHGHGGGGGGGDDGGGDGF